MTAVIQPEKILKELDELWVSLGKQEQGSDAILRACAMTLLVATEQPAETDAWYAPSMYNIVQQNGQDVHIVIKPDHGCEVNSGLGSVRGARMGELRFSRARNSQQQRLTDPMVWRYGQMQPTSWDDALDLVSRVTAAVVKEQGEDGLFVSMFDHGGSAGGYENTWGTGKLYFGSMKVKNVRIHNRPAYNSEVHATRDMGVGELNNCYEDAELADTIVAVGTNPLETQTNYFLNHWIPNLRGTSLDKKKAQMPDEPHAAARIIIVDPRRTVTVNACEIEAGKENVLHLQLNSGTDLALVNAIFTEIVAKGWVDKDFIANSTFQGDVAQPLDEAHPAALGGFEAARAECKMTLADGAKVCGVSEADMVKAAEWIAKPKDDGSRRKCVTAYEKGIIWGNDNYRTIGALVNIALATGNVGREGGGVCRLGGHAGRVRIASPRNADGAAANHSRARAHDARGTGAHRDDRHRRVDRRCDYVDRPDAEGDVGAGGARSRLAARRHGPGRRDFVDSGHGAADHQQLADPEHGSGRADGMFERRACHASCGAPARNRAYTAVRSAAVSTPANGVT